mgnify:CR=1 FL=1
MRNRGQSILQVIVAFLDEILIILIILSIVFYALYTLNPISIYMLVPLVIVIALITAMLIMKVTRAQLSKPKVGIEALIGKEALVIDEIKPMGKVVVEGEIWNARSINNEYIPRGEKVIITNIKDFILIVEKQE